MKLTVQIIVATIVVAALVAAVKTEAPRPDIPDEALETFLKDRRYLERQLKCALGQLACDSVGRRLKSLAPLVLSGSCPQCSPKESKQIYKVLAHVQKNYPKEWQQILQQYAG